MESGLPQQQHRQFQQHRYFRERHYSNQPQQLNHNEELQKQQLQQQHRTQQDRGSSQLGSEVPLLSSSPRIAHGYGSTNNIAELATSQPATEPMVLGETQSTPGASTSFSRRMPPIAHQLSYVSLDEMDEVQSDTNKKRQRVLEHQQEPGYLMASQQFASSPMSGSSPMRNPFLSAAPRQPVSQFAPPETRYDQATSTQPQVNEQTELMSNIPLWYKFVLQWDIKHMGVPLGCFGFTAMWQAVAFCIDAQIVNLNVIWYLLYFISCLVMFVCGLIYIIRATTFPRALQTDFNDSRLFNFFFMPVLIGCLWVVSTPPPLQTITQHKVTFYVLGTYQVLLGLYTYGQWLTSLHVTEIIHPTVLLHTIGYFMLTTVAATAGMYEQGLFMFSLGAILWLVIFVSNFQHLSSSLRSRNEGPQPTFFIFVGPPAQACFAALALQICENMSSSNTGGSLTSILTFSSAKSWPHLAEAFFFIDIFLYALMFRISPSFLIAPFAVSWWAYIFPMSACAGATLWRYNVTGSSVWFAFGILLVSFSTFAMVIVSWFMIDSLRAGTIPKNQRTLEDYCTQFLEQNPTSSQPFSISIRNHVLPRT